MNLKKALNGINIQLLNSLEYGDEIQLNDLYSLYHYSEDDCVVVNRTEDWTELVQVLWDDDNDSIIFEVIDNDQYHIEMGIPIGNLEVTPDYESKYKSLQLQVIQMFKYMDENRTTLWRDDLQCTHECVILEDVEDGVKMDEDDNPYMACSGSNVITMMENIKKTHLA